MNITKEEYKKIAQKHAKASPIVRNCLNAFWVGGFICVIGQIFYRMFLYYGVKESTSKTVSTLILIFMAVLLTGIGVFDKIAKIGGAGTLVPITSFSNAVVAPALDTKSEGWILGVGAKLFTIAGAVIVYGTIASIIYGVIYWYMTL